MNIRVRKRALSAAEQFKDRHHLNQPLKKFNHLKNIKYFKYFKYSYFNEVY